MQANRTINRNVVLSLKILMSSEDFQDNHSWRLRHLVDQYMNFECANPKPMFPEMTLKILSFRT